MRRPFFIAYFALFVGGAVLAEPQKGFYRYPALHGDTVVFAAEGDLWRVGTAGGVARRLTTHPGEESYPRISPDGSVLAFTARYEGPVELYTMPVDGGLPVRRSYEAETSRVTTWTPGGKLVYATTHYATLPNPQLVALDIDTGVRERIPLSQATEGSYDASGQSLYFVRPAFHRNVTKRYKGGTARKIWKFTDGADEAVVLTADYAGESHSPMWWSGRVYFVSDRDGTMNVWSIDEGGADRRQHTRHSGWGRQAAVARKRPHRLRAGRGSATLQYPRRRRSLDRHLSCVGLRSAAREMGNGADGVFDLGAHPSERRQCRAHGARPCFRGSCEGRPDSAALPASQPSATAMRFSCPTERPF